MVILELYQNDYSKDLVAFDSIEDGKAFVAQIPGYTLETEDGFEVEYFNPKNIGFRLILRKMWTLFGKRFQIYPSKTIE